MIYLLYAFLAIVVPLIALNRFLRGQLRPQIELFLSILVIGLLVAATVFGGWKGALMGVFLTVVSATASRPFAARLASRLLASTSGQRGRFPGFPPARLRRISRELGHPLDPGRFVEELAVGAARRQGAKDALFAYCSGSSRARAVLEELGVTRDEFSELYEQLIWAGAGGWACGHWVAASALAYAETLRYSIEGSRQGQDRKDMAIALFRHFERGLPLMGQ